MKDVDCNGAHAHVCNALLDVAGAKRACCLIHTLSPFQRHSSKAATRQDRREKSNMYVASVSRLAQQTTYFRGKTAKLNDGDSLSAVSHFSVNALRHDSSDTFTPLQEQQQAFG